MKKLNKNIFSLKLSSSKGFFDLWNVRNWLKIFWKHYKGSLMTKRQSKGDTVELKVEANLPWTDSYEKLKKNNSSLKFSLSKGFFNLWNARNRLKLFREGYKGSIISNRHCKGDKLKLFNGEKRSEMQPILCLAVCSTRHQSFNYSINQSINLLINQSIN